VKRILKHFGLFVPKLKEPKVEYPEYKYQKKISREHLIYLKDLLEFQRDRQSTIENKTSQLVGQSSVVFSLVALFVPLFYDKFIDTELLVKIILLSLFLLAFIFYLFTIIHSTRALSIHKYRYSTGDPKTVLSKNSSKEFVEEQISDLVFSINLNSYSNDQKGTNLILAHRTFSFGNRVFALLAFVLCLLSFFSPNRQSTEEEQLLLLRKIEQMHSQLERDLLQRDEKLREPMILEDSIN
jgi:hypothetical protein